MGFSNPGRAGVNCQSLLIYQLIPRGGIRVPGSKGRGEEEEEEREEHLPTADSNISS